MQTRFVLLVAVLFLGGCAARLPVGGSGILAEDGGVPTRFARAEATPMMRACLARREEAEEAEPFRRHEVGLFLGYTFERGEGGASLGLDYTYLINEWLGVGPFFDFVAGDLDALAMGAGVWVRPVRCLRSLAFYVAPGVDISQAREETEEGEKRPWETAFLLRFGAMYKIEIGRGYTVSPSIYLDWIGFEKSATAIGLTLGKEF